MAAPADAAAAATHPPAAPTVATTTAYRLMPAEELAAFRDSGSFKGSGIDLRDGFIHMSVAAAVRDTANLYFKGCANVMVVRVDLSALPASALRWDWVASRETHFPHLYGEPLPWSAVAATFGPLAVGEDGKFVLPAEIP